MSLLAERQLFFKTHEVKKLLNPSRSSGDKDKSKGTPVRHMVEGKSKEDGEISNESSPLKNFDSKKQKALDGRNIRDSLKRSSGRNSKKPESHYSSESSDGQLSELSETDEPEGRFLQIMNRKPTNSETGWPRLENII